MFVTRILLVDDFLPWQRYVLTPFESEAEFKIIAVIDDGVAAVQKAKELLPDVILMDISLPRMNGIEAPRQIRFLCPDSKILFVTAHHDCNLIEDGLDVPQKNFPAALVNRTHPLPFTDQTARRIGRDIRQVGQLFVGNVEFNAPGDFLVDTGCQIHKDMGEPLASSLGKLRLRGQQHTKTCNP